MRKSQIPRALTIAGSDSGGGAGIQADLKTFAALGVYGMSALTAITAQNTVGVLGVVELPASFVGLQIDVVLTDIGADAVKTGMLSNSEIIAVIAAKMAEYRVDNLVVDPVMVAKSGAPLLRPEARQALIEQLIPLAKVLTPNLQEARVLTSLEIESLEAMKEAARAIQRLGARNVVVKGGHLPGSPESIDVLYDGHDFTEFTAPRLATKNTHGTGCTFASAIAAGLAKGQSVQEAVGAAKRLVTVAVRYGLPLGAGHGPANQLAELYLAAGRAPGLQI
jgi:hydroxymethylpyrimidine/phosphomethylpyrimidine kinase